MRTQNILNTIRLLTYTLIISLFAYSATANNNTDSALFAGGGEGENETSNRTERIELEQWMLEKENFSVSETQNETKATEGHPLESWMINGDFEIENNPENNDQHPLESWMLDRSNFQIKDNNELEDWMMKRKCFKTEEIRDFGSIKDWMLNRSSFTI